MTIVGCKDPAPKPGSLEYSKQLYDGCVQCHGENGEGNIEVGAPAIAGLTRWYVKRQLRNFRKSTAAGIRRTSLGSEWSRWPRR